MSDENRIWFFIKRLSVTLHRIGVLLYYTKWFRILVQMSARSVFVLNMCWKILETASQGRTSFLCFFVYGGIVCVWLYFSISFYVVHTQATTTNSEKKKLEMYYFSYSALRRQCHESRHRDTAMFDACKSYCEWQHFWCCICYITRLYTCFKHEYIVALEPFK